MISLIINSKCNQKCKYCFAYDTLHDNNNIMSLDTIRQVIDFQLKANDPMLKYSIGIVGGEPTLHPQFQDIIDILTNHYHTNHICSVIFTNGTRLHEYDIDNDAGIRGLINVNHPDMVGAGSYNNTFHSIRKYIYNKENPLFTIGTNIYPGLTDYSFIFDIAKQNNISEIRAAVVCPDGEFKNLRNNREEYFEKSIKPFIAFCEQAIKNDVKINMDCCKIPACYFTEAQKDIVKKACIIYSCISGHFEPVCLPHIDIHPDLSVTHCFIRPENIYMNDFETPDLLNNYIYNNWIIPMRKGMKYGRCASCSSFEYNTCIGGCLRFSRKGV